MTSWVRSVRCAPFDTVEFMQAYFLPPHVHVGYRQGALIFLDLKNDDYTLVDGAAAAAVLTVSAKGGAGSIAITGEQDLQELLEGRLLTTERGAGKTVAVTKREPVVERLADREAAYRLRITAVDFWRFVAACTKAVWRLRFQHIESIVARVSRRKSRRLAASDPMDIVRARELTAKFQRLRYLFPRNYVCLYDSLALLEFLAPYGVFPTWIFGVTLEPWGAHCWVQEAGYAFNEEVEEVANYTPVMAI